MRLCSAWNAGAIGDGDGDAHSCGTPATFIRIGPSRDDSTKSARDGGGPAIAGDEGHRRETFVDAAHGSLIADAAASSALDGKRERGGEGDGERGGPESFLDIDVVVNPPGVTSLECPITSPMMGSSIVAQAKTEFATGVCWEWFREGPTGNQGGRLVVWPFSVGHAEMRGAVHAAACG